MVLYFFERLYSTSVQHREGDRLVWNPFKKGLFEVKWPIISVEKYLVC
jgi:hypothetical protein